MSQRRVTFTHRNLPHLLLQARESVTACCRPILQDNGITEQQWRVVRALIEFGSMEPRELVGICSISSPSLAGVLARMDEIGLISRERFDKDQRRLRVSPTPRGRALAARVAPKVEATYAKIEACISSEFTHNFCRALDDLIAALRGEADRQQTPRE